jgi:hypothetical protein
LLNSQKQFSYYTTPGFPAWWGGGWQGGWGWGWDGGQTFYQDNFAEIRAKQSEVIRNGAADREAVSKAIADERNTIRRRMLEKFKVDFKG